MENFNRKQNVFFYFILVAVFSLCGCAGGKGNVKVVEPFKDSMKLNAYENLELRAESDENLPLTQDDMDRIINLVQNSKQNQRKNARSFQRDKFR